MTNLYGDTRLSEKELRIVELVAEGLNNKDIAPLIGNTEPVLKNYIRVILDKTGMNTRLELALWYVSREG
jgi:DNA-binding NarL/FixJ family response regulator